MITDVSLKALTRILKDVEDIAGVKATANGNNVTALGIWRTLKEFYFSVPPSEELSGLSDTEQEAVLEDYVKQATGMSRTVWLAATRRKLRANAAKAEQAKTFKKLKRI